METGRPVALIGGNTNDWLVSWIACQLAGTPVALLNPAFPDQLVSDVLRPLAPQAVLSSDVRDAVAGVEADWIPTAGAAQGARPGPVPWPTCRGSVARPPISAATC